MSLYLLAIDQGTTGTKAIVMTQDLQVHSEVTIEFEQHFPQPGWVEHDLDQIWDSTKSAITQALKGLDAKKVQAIGITNQRETVCFWEQGSTKAIRKAIVWQDRRTSKECETLKAARLESLVQRKTGLLLDPYFSGTKIAWALEHDPAVQKAAQGNTLKVGTIDSFLMARLTGGTAHCTEPSNASRTLLFNIHDLSWDKELCEKLKVPMSILPEVKPSVGEFGKTQGLSFLPDGIPIMGCLGDQQSALLGQACIEEGSAKCTYGTGAFILMNTGKKTIQSMHRLLTTVAWQIHGETTYALEGSAFVAGAAVQWIRDQLGLLEKSSDSEPVAASVPDTAGVVFVPALTGLGAPHWDPEARGLFCGLTRGANRAHLVRAVLEGIAFQNADILFAMRSELGSDIRTLRVDGGAAANGLLMQFQSDILNVTLDRPQFLGTTSIGAIFAAGLGAGVWKSLEDVKQSWIADRTFQPKISDHDRATHLKRWEDAILRTKLRT